LLPPRSGEQQSEKLFGSFFRIAKYFLIKNFPLPRRKLLFSARGDLLHGKAPRNGGNFAFPSITAENPFAGGDYIATHR
jgi:hypothetical protein